MDLPVAQSWRRITAWLERHAPTTAAALRPPAEAAELLRTENAVGRSLPTDLLDWWRLMDGIADAHYHKGEPIPPYFLPLPVADVRERFASLSPFADDCCRIEGEHTTMAGQTSFGFCTATIPICWNSGGDVLVVDLREGTQRGCIMEWTAEEGYIKTDWAGTGAMLADVADRLNDPTRHEIVDDGVLQWRI
jgi:cell wall assembly regulator SMI1